MNVAGIRKHINFAVAREDDSTRCLVVYDQPHNFGAVDHEDKASDPETSTMNSHSRPPKRRRRHCDPDHHHQNSWSELNPLARARGGKTTTTATTDRRSTTNPPSLADHRSHVLWHKKSGGGYLLFLQYYMQLTQRHALLTPPAHDNTTHKTEPAIHPDHSSSPNDGRSMSHPSTSSTTNSSNPERRGESRASKRRRRRRGQPPPPTIQEQEQDNSPTESNKSNSQSSSKGFKSTPSASGSTQGGPFQLQPLPQEQPVNGKQQHGLVQAWNRLLDSSKTNKDEEKILNHETIDALIPWMTSLTLPLPLCFRIRSWLDPAHQDTLAHAVRTQFTTWMERLDVGRCPTTNDHVYLYRAKPHSSSSSWNRHCVSKESLGKEAPELKAWLLEQSSHCVARQELGSMLPVLLLSRVGLVDQPDKHKDCAAAAATRCLTVGSRVLDMCASPGSKTLQALEVVGATGKIKANDIHASRLQSLQQAVERANPPKETNRRIQYTNVDASQYPIPKHGHKLYTAILCDVPCSGDGTIRKDAHILPHWTPQTSNALHALQVRILQRGLQCLAVGGVLCYSTCSMNPVENEAVVAAALRSQQKQASPSSSAHANLGGGGGGIQVELIPLPSLGQITLRPGLSSWSVADFEPGSTRDNRPNDTDDMKNDDEEDDELPKLLWYDTYEEAQRHGMKHAVPSLWPPTNNSDIETCLPLDRCGRLWPHDHDCGGFFVALLRRTR